MRPLANLFAYRDEDPAALQGVAADLAAAGEFSEVFRPAPGWVAAVAPLPGSVADGHAARSRGLAFAEGRELLAPAAQGGEGDALQRIADLAAEAPARLGELRGDFGFVRFGADGAATAVRSCGGLVPVYLWQRDGRAALATRLGDLVRYLREEPALDPLVNAVWTTGYGLWPDARTFVVGVSILRRGGFAEARPGRPWMQGHYWDPRPRSLAPVTPAREREHAERLRGLLVDRLARDLDPAGGNLLTLSGGVDSSALGALAARTLGLPVSTWSLLPHPRDLYEHEMSFIAPLAKTCGFERQWVLRMVPTTRVDLLHAAPPIAFPVMHPALCDLPRVAGEAPVRVLFGGEFADEVCGSAFTMPDWIRHTSPARLLLEPGRLPKGPRDVLRWAKHRALAAARRSRLPLPAALGDIVRAQVREEYREWLDRCRRRVLSDPRPWRDLALRAELDGFVAMNWEACSALGIRRSFPFFNREALELAFDCHPRELVAPGTKRLLRAALEADVPARNLHRADKGHWGSYLRDATLPWRAALPDGLRAVVREDWMPTPPLSMTAWEAFNLTQLVLFSQALAARGRVRARVAA